MDILEELNLWKEATARYARMMLDAKDLELKLEDEIKHWKKKALTHEKQLEEIQKTIDYDGHYGNMPDIIREKYINDKDNNG